MADHLGTRRFPSQEVKDRFCEMHTKKRWDDARYCWLKHKTEYESSLFNLFQRWRRLAVFSENSFQSTGADEMGSNWSRKPKILNPQPEHKQIINQVLQKSQET